MSNVSPTRTFNLDEIVSIKDLATIFGVTVNALYQDKDRGRFGTKELTEMTVGEAISTHRVCLMRANELKKDRMEQEIAIKREAQQKREELRALKGGSSSDSLMSLQEKSLEQKIRLDRSKEIQTWLAIAEERNQLLIKANLLELYTPLFNLIKNGLVSLSSDYPDTRERVDGMLTEWHKIGQRLLEQSEKDMEDFVEEMLEKSLDDSMIELQFVPENRG